MEPVIFRFQNRVVRQVTINDEPGFVAKDVAEALGYKWNGTSRIAHVPEEWRGVTSVVTLRGDAQDMAVLTEQGLYFFLGRSDKQAAIPFQKWLAGEVLPTIRKTGSYISPNAEPAPEQPSIDPEQCQQCRIAATSAIWDIQHYLLVKVPLWNDIRKYHQLGLTNKEIGKLVSLGPAALRRQMKDMRACGLLFPRNERELGQMKRVSFRHKHGLPYPYGLESHRGKQLELFPMGALQGGH
jgi:prophage antirepressor-like protein